MARGKRTDIETKARIVIDKLKNPDLSTRDIANNIWGIDNTTVNDILNDILPQLPTDSQRIARIFNNDMESVENMSVITKRFTQELKAKEELDRADIAVANTTTESAFKRSQLFSWKPTESYKISDYSSLTEKELEEARNQLL